LLLIASGEREFRHKELREMARKSAKFADKKFDQKQIEDRIRQKTETVQGTTKSAEYGYDLVPRIRGSSENFRGP